MKNLAKEFLKYCVVGGIAFLADALTLFAFVHFTKLHYLVAAVFGFVAGLLVNFILAKLFVFNKVEARVKPFAEFLSYGIIGVIGLGLTEIFLYIFTDKLGLWVMFSKCITAGIVLVWNYLARKIFLYRKSKV
ncbi:MAG: GtrA family protein [Ruminococcus sp.]|nr:GtrA family protein [Ruminococcus sp.]